METIYKAGIPVRMYSAVHHWLKYHYGPATKCESKDCNGKSNNYTWAKKKNKEYAYNRKHFIQLCRSCHAKQDSTPEGRQRTIDSKKGKKLPPHVYEALRKKTLGVPRTEELKEKLRKANLGRKMSEESKIKMRQSSRNTIKTHCKRGHEFTAENTEYKKGYIDGYPHRRCITCKKYLNKKNRESINNLRVE